MSVRFGWFTVTFVHTFSTLNGHTRVKSFFLYKLLFFLGFLMHFILLNLDMYAQSYGRLKLQGCVCCIARFEISGV